MVTWMNELIGSFLDWVYKLLPMSPFAPYIEKFGKLPYLEYLNWFIPVSEILVVLGSWLVAIFLWYLYGIILRWIKAAS